MKYIKVTGRKEVDIIINFVWVFIAVGFMAYGLGYLGGVLYGCRKTFLAD